MRDIHGWNAHLRRKLPHPLSTCIHKGAQSPSPRLSVTWTVEYLVMKKCSLLRPLVLPGQSEKRQDEAIDDGISSPNVQL